MIICRIHEMVQRFLAKCRNLSIYQFINLPICHVIDPLVNCYIYTLIYFAIFKYKGHKKSTIVMYTNQYWDFWRNVGIYQFTNLPICHVIDPLVNCYIFTLVYFAISLSIWHNRSTIVMYTKQNWDFWRNVGIYQFINLSIYQSAM